MKKIIIILLIFVFLLICLHVPLYTYIMHNLSNISVSKLNMPYASDTSERAGPKCDVNVKVKKSKLLDGATERGLFATKDFTDGEIIEECPALLLDINDMSNENYLHNYFFGGNLGEDESENKRLIAFGYCSMINHSDEKQNCTWKVAPDNSTVTMYAIRDIKKGEELFSNYGEEYWKSKNNKV
jgi:hypothetical protein